MSSRIPIWGGPDYRMPKVQNYQCSRPKGSQRSSVCKTCATKNRSVKMIRIRPNWWTQDTETTSKKNSLEYPRAGPVLTGDHLPPGAPSTTCFRASNRKCVGGWYEVEAAFGRKTRAPVYTWFMCLYMYIYIFSRIKVLMIQVPNHSSEHPHMT
jgi:hypothetical protein